MKKEKNERPKKKEMKGLPTNKMRVVFEMLVRSMLFSPR